MKNILLTSLLVWHITTNAQQWVNYINSGQVSSAAEHDDTVWAGTAGGVVKYLKDGTELARYTHADGLASNNVLGVAVDKNGHKWFTCAYSVGGGGGYGGVTRFDGTNWITYDSTNSTLGNSAAGVAVDAQNNIWVTLSTGLAKFNGVSWQHYTSANSLLPSNEVSNLKADMAGNIWMYCYSADKFVKISDTTFTLIPKPAGYTGGGLGMAIDIPGNLWIAWKLTWPGSQQGIAKYNGTTWTTVSGAYNSESVAVDRYNNKWFVSSNQLVKFDDVSWTTYTAVSSGTNIKLFFIDSLDNKWLQVSAAGLGKFADTTLSVYNPSATGLTNNDVVSLVIDRHDNKWLRATIWISGLLTKFNGTAWEPITEILTRALFADSKDRLWFGTSYFDGTNVITPYNAPDVTVSEIDEDPNGNIWFATQSDGIYKYDGNTWVNYHSGNSGLVSNQAHTIAIDKQGVLWCGTFTGLLKFDGVNWTTYSTSTSGLADNIVYSLAVDTLNNKWVGTSNGLTKYNGVNWITYDTTNSNIPGSRINVITVDKTNAIWLGTESSVTHKPKGATKFNGTTFTTYNITNSDILSNTVFSIAVDDRNNKWFATNNGISQLLSGDPIFDAGIYLTGNTCTDSAVTLNALTYNGTPPYSYNWQTTANLLSCNTCTNPTLTVTENSLAVLSVTDAGNNTTTDTLYIYYCGYLNSIEAYKEDMPITVYPNPAQSHFYVNTPNNNANTTYTLFDLYGRQRITGTITGTTTQIDVGELPAGMYVLKAGNYKPKLLQVAGK